MQIKSIVRYHLTPVTMAIIKKTKNKKQFFFKRQKITSVGEDVEQRTLKHCWQECELVQPLWKQVQRILKIIKNRTAISSGNFTSGSISKGNKNTKLKRCLHTNVYSSIIYNSQDMETTQVSVNGQMDKDVVVYTYIIYVHFSSVAQLYPNLCDPVDCSTPGLPVHHQLPEFTQTHVHGVGDAIQPSHLLSSPSPPAFNLSQHQDLFQ